MIKVYDGQALKMLRNEVYGGAVKWKRTGKLKKRQPGRKGAPDHPWPIYDIKALGNQ